MMIRAPLATAAAATTNTEWQSFDGSLPVPMYVRRVRREREKKIDNQMEKRNGLCKSSVLNLPIDGQKNDTEMQTRERERGGVNTKWECFMEDWKRPSNVDLNSKMSFITRRVHWSVNLSSSVSGSAQKNLTFTRKSVRIKIVSLLEQVFVIRGHRRSLWSLRFGSWGLGVDKKWLLFS